MQNVIPMSKQVQMLGEYASRLSQDLGEAEAQKVLNGAVYVISIGFALTAMRYMYSPMYTAHLADLARGFVSDMYKVGARKVGFFTLGPLGCIPINRARYGGLICDEAGNAVARAFNDAVRQTAGALNAQLPGLDFRMADLYPIMDAIEKNPPQYGFDHADRACCGTGTFEIGPACMMMSCPDASKYVYWDTVHTTQHTNQIVAAYLMNTTFAALAA
jgi:phospholipase/lecithinase/hemolysin